MLSRTSSSVSQVILHHHHHRDGRENENELGIIAEDSSSWSRNNNNVGCIKQEMSFLPGTFRPLLDDCDWYVSNHNYGVVDSSVQQLDQAQMPDGIHHDSLSQTHHTLTENVLLNSLDSSPSALGIDHDHSESFFHPRHSLTSLLTRERNYPFDNAVDLICNRQFMDSFHEGQTPPVLLNGASDGFMGFNGLNLQPQSMADFDVNAISQFQTTHLLPLVENGGGAAIGSGVSPLGFDSYGTLTNPLFPNVGKEFKSFYSPSTIGTIPAPFQTGAALTSSNSQEDIMNVRNSGEVVSRISVDFTREKGKKRLDEEQDFTRKSNGEDGINEVDVSGFNSDSDELTGKYASNSLISIDTNWNSNADGSGCNDQKGKKKGLPAKNLMAERRRRKKLNDRLYMLRSVVPKISKMDRASILADAIEYLKELLQKIKDLNDELQSTPPANSSLPSTSSVEPWESAPAAGVPPFPCQVKEEICKNTMPSTNNQPPSIQVEVREGDIFNIHMFCTRRPGLLLSTMGALDSLGIDVQQAVISCFNGFALDIFKAEKYAGVEVHSEQIKAALLETAAFHGLI